MCYAASFPDIWRRAATYVEKILKGAKPADLPVEQPNKYELTINLKAAKAIVLTIPPTFLTRVEQAWTGSLESLRTFGENVGLAIVAMAPWLAILGILVGPLVWWRSRRNARGAAQKATTDE